MFHTCSALVPGLIVSAWIFGERVLVVVGCASIVAIVTELVCTRSWSLTSDGSALLTALLVGLAVPSTTSLWIVALAVVIALALGKHAYGGTGNNLFNPAMVGYAVVLVSFPQQLTYWDAVTGATALDQVAHRGGKTLFEISSSSTFGFVGDQHFEWINVAFLLGGIYLVVLRIISWIIPCAVLIGMSVPAILTYDGGSSQSLGSPMFHLFAGATMLTAFFIATDPVTSPSDKTGQWVTGLFIGATSFVIRASGNWPDGFAFAVLLANLFTPLLDQRYIRSRSIKSQ